jgi:hypothetical protein
VVNHRAVKSGTTKPRRPTKLDSSTSLRPGRRLMNVFIFSPSARGTDSGEIQPTPRRRVGRPSTTAPLFEIVTRCCGAPIGSTLPEAATAATPAAPTSPQTSAKRRARLTDDRLSARHRVSVHPRPGLTAINLPHDHRRSISEAWYQVLQSRSAAATGMTGAAHFGSVSTRARRAHPRAAKRSGARERWAWLVVFQTLT